MYSRLQQAHGLMAVHALIWCPWVWYPWSLLQYLQASTNFGKWDCVCSSLYISLAALWDELTFFTVKVWVVPLNGYLASGFKKAQQKEEKRAAFRYHHSWFKDYKITSEPEKNFWNVVTCAEKPEASSHAKNFSSFKDLSWGTNVDHGTREKNSSFFPETLSRDHLYRTERADRASV